METAFAPGLQAGNRDCATAVRVLIIALRRVGQRGLQASKLRCIAEPSGNRSVRPGQIRIGFGEPRNETIGPDEKSDLRRQGTAGPRPAAFRGIRFLVYRSRLLTTRTGSGQNFYLSSLNVIVGG